MEDVREQYELEKGIYDAQQAYSEMAVDDPERMDPDTGADLYDEVEHGRAEEALNGIGWTTLNDDVDGAQEALDEFDGLEVTRLTEEFEARQEEYNEFKDNYQDAKAATKEAKNALKAKEKELKANTDPEAVQELNDRLAEL